MRTRRPEPHTLSGAYALDALPRADRARFERHLARCEQCEREVTGLREAAARLGAATPVTPSAALTRQVLAAAARTRQLPPVPAGQSASWLARRAGRSAGPLRRPWIPRLALALTAGAVILAGFLGVTARNTEHQLAGDQQRSQAITAILTAPDATMLTARVDGGGTATVVMSSRQHALVFAAAGLRPLPASRSYELWLMGPGGDQPAGMLSSASRGMTDPALAEGVRAGEKIGLSVEPAAGSPRPTSAMILVLAL